jgi:single-strand DNA-binding protein
MMLVQLIGNVGTDPESRVSPSGQKITSFRMAINVKRQGKEQTVWWRVTIFGDRFEKMLPYIKKGSALFVMGTMNPSEIYQSRDGTSQISYDVIAAEMSFISTGRSEKAGQEGGQQQEGSYTPAYQPQQQGQFQPRPQPQPFSGVTAGAQAKQDFTDDDIPF